MIDIEQFITDHADDTLEQLIDAIYSLTNHDGEAKQYNEAVRGPDVKDSIVRLALLIRGMLDKTKEDISTISTEREFIDAFDEVINIDENDVMFDGDVYANGNKKLATSSSVENLAGKAFVNNGNYSGASLADITQNNSLYWDAPDSAVADKPIPNVGGFVLTNNYINIWQQIYILFSSTADNDRGKMWVRNKFGNGDYSVWSRINVNGAEKDKLERASGTLVENNIVDLFKIHGKFEDNKVGNVDYTWDNSRKQWSVFGSTSGTINYYGCLIQSVGNIPDGLSVGKKYLVTANSSDATKVWVEVIVRYEGEEDPTTIAVTSKKVIAVTADMTSLSARIRVGYNKTISQESPVTIAPTMITLPITDVLLDNLTNHNNYDVIKDIKRTSRTSAGITYTWNATECTVTGMRNGNSFCIIKDGISALPEGFVPGATYLLKINSPSGNVSLEFVFYTDGETSGGTKIVTTSEQFVTLPLNTTGVLVRIAAYRNYDFGAGETVKPEIIFVNKPVLDVSKYPKMFVKGSSTMVGSVWTLNETTGTVSLSHYPSDWGFAPYSVIAKKLGITKENVNNNILHSSTGLLYAPAAPSTGEPETVGSFIDNIMGNSSLGIDAPDLKGYDYLLTMCSVNDLRYFLLDTEEPHIGMTIKEGVITLINYLRSNYPFCRLIIVSAFPSPERFAADGSIDPITYEWQYDSDNTIIQTVAQLDALMHELADDYGFKYIDWQNWAGTKYWQKYTGGDYNGRKINNPHFNNEKSYRSAGLYLAEHV